MELHNTFTSTSSQMRNGVAAYLNLGHTKGRWGDSLQLELPQLPVAAGHSAFPSIDDKGHVGLVVMHCGEDLLPMARHSQRGGDEHMLLVPNHGNTYGRPLLWKLPALEHVLVGGCPCRAATESVHRHIQALQWHSGSNRRWVPPRLQRVENDETADHKSIRVQGHEQG